MKKYLLTLLLLASCASPKETTGDVCPVADRDIRQNSCVAIKAEATLGSVVFAWANPTNFWPRNDDGMVALSVQFLGGGKVQRQQAFKRFSRIDAIADGLQVRLASPGEVGDIRCAFGCSGHWSFLGKAAKTIGRDKATMNLELDAFASEQEWDRVATHEFCHAIGIEHEHQHPDANIPWDVPAVEGFYRTTQGWSTRETHFQVIDRKTVPNAWKTAFDKGSIMLYPILPQHTKGQLSVGWNTRLSPLDIEMIRRIFPKP